MGLSWVVTIIFCVALEAKRDHEREQERKGLDHPASYGFAAQEELNQDIDRMLADLENLQ